MSTIETIKSQIKENPVLLYMKGTPEQPQCGFSSQTVQALMACGRPFSFVNILDHPDIRAELPKYAEWPTFPQLWINSELIGLYDHKLEMLAKHLEGKQLKIIDNIRSLPELLYWRRKPESKGTH